MTPGQTAQLLFLVMIIGVRLQHAAGNLEALVMNLTTLLEGPQNIGPVFHKTAEAALYTTLAYRPSALGSLGVDDAVIIPYPDGGHLLVVWEGGNTSSTVHLAFQSPDTRVAQQIERGNDLSAFPLTPALVTSATPQVNTAALDLFASVLQPAAMEGASLTEVITQRGFGAPPRRIVCSGHSTGGSLATLCGPWAAGALPSAFVRVITFGAPQVGDAVYQEVFEQLVDLHYAWELPPDTGDHNLSLSRPDRRLQQDVQDSLEAAAQAELDAERSEEQLQQYLETLIAEIGTGNVSTSLAGQNRSNGLGTLTDGNSTFSCDQHDNCTLKDFVVALENDIVAAEALQQLYDGDASSAGRQGHLLQTAPAPAPASGTFNAQAGTPLNETDYELWPSDCQPILCKVQPQVIAACRIYEQNLTEPSAFIVTPQFDANVGVQWDPATSTAMFAFQGSISQADWILDLFAVLVLEKLYPNASVHWGFLQQAQSVTDRSSLPEYNLQNVLSSLNDGAAPSHVFVTGHSLGAAVATLIGPWAALQWPAADVRVSTFGSPQVGNAAFAQACQELVGRQYRVVNEADIVPALPGFGSYTHVNYSLWSSDEQLLAEERPKAPISNFDWPDHSCALYQGAILLVDNVTLYA